MAYAIEVQPKIGDKFYSEDMEKDEAEKQLVEVKDKLGSGYVPDLSWLAIQGLNIVSARVIETTPSQASAVQFH